MFELQAKIDGFAWKGMGKFETEILAVAAAEQIDLDTPVRVMCGDDCVWSDGWCLKCTADCPHAGSNEPTSPCGGSKPRGRFS